jgi:hypothetical protein
MLARLVRDDIERILGVKLPAALCWHPLGSWPWALAGCGAAAGVEIADEDNLCTLLSAERQPAPAGFRGHLFGAAATPASGNSHRGAPLPGSTCRPMPHNAIPIPGSTCRKMPGQSCPENLLSFLNAHEIKGCGYGGSLRGPFKHNESGLAQPQPFES